MSWSVGSTLFLEMWPILEKNIEDEDDLYDTAKEIIKVLERKDMDIHDLLNVHDSLDEFLEAVYGLSEDEECFTGHQSENSLLMKIAKELAKRFNTSLESGDDCIELRGRPAGTNQRMWVSLYNFADREYRVAMLSEIISFDGSEATSIQKKKTVYVESEYDFKKKAYITDKINYDHLLGVAIQAIRDFYKDPEGWSAPEPAYPSSWTLSEYQEALDELHPMLMEP